MYCHQSLYRFHVLQRRESGGQAQMTQLRKGGVFPFCFLFYDTIIQYTPSAWTGNKNKNKYK